MPDIRLTDAEREALVAAWEDFKARVPGTFPSIEETIVAFLTAALSAVPRLALASLTPNLWWDAESQDISYPDEGEAAHCTEMMVGDVRRFAVACSLPDRWIATLPRMLDIVDGVHEWDDPEPVAFATEAEAVAALRQRQDDLIAALTGEEATGG